MEFCEGQRPDFEAGSKRRCRRCWRAQVRVPIRARRPGEGRPDLSHQRHRSGVALSFFLWNTVPDAELVKVATGALHAGGAREQVRGCWPTRAPNRSARFACSGCGSRTSRRFTPTHCCSPASTTSWRPPTSVRRALLQQHRAGGSQHLDVLTADYTVNERIARVYRMPNIVGENFRRVTVPTSAADLRPGQHADADRRHDRTRRSSAANGSWKYPGSPPPRHCQIRRRPSRQGCATGGKPSTRASVEEHRKNAACQPCHKVIDPLGPRRQLRHAWRLPHQGQRRRDRLERRIQRHQADRPGRSAQGAAEPPEGLIRNFTDNLLSRDRPPHRMPRSADDRASRRKPRRTGTASRRSSWASSTVRPSESTAKPSRQPRIEGVNVHFEETCLPARRPEGTWRHRRSPLDAMVPARTVFAKTAAGVGVQAAPVCMEMVHATPAAPRLA